MDLKEKVIAEIRKIYDPEIPVNIYELGLIYNVKVEKNKHSLIYSLLFAFCAALFSTTISPIIYFYRINLFN